MPPLCCPLAAWTRTIFHSSIYIVARGGHGKTQFGVQTQYLIDRLSHINTVICLGAAGALATDLAVGDIVIASETVEHDYTQRFRPHPLPRFPADPALLAGFQQLPLQRLAFRVHVGIMASGDEDVIELERATALQHVTAACAVAWGRCWWCAGSPL